MEYSLSNSLVGGSGSLNPDGLSLDLQFAADKTLTARRGPTPAFTRGSGDTGGVTYIAPSDIIVQYTYLGIDNNATLIQDVATGVNNGRWQWVDDIVTIIYYTGTAWALTNNGNLVATSAPASQAWRPDLADWSGTGVIITNGTPYKLVRAATNEPRFNYDPIDLTSKGLLIEESRTNQTKYSYNNFTNAYWESTASNVTAVDSVTTNPPDSFIPTFSSLTEIAGVSISRHIHEATGVFTPIANTAYTMSVWVKRPPSNQIRYVQLAFWIAGFGSTAYMNYDILLGQVKTGGAGITASSITEYPNGWYRITATATSVSSPAASGFQLGFSTTPGAARTEAYTVVTPLKSIYLWGAQVEAGAFSTSYIPTTTTSLTRSADVCSISGAAFSDFYNRFSGTAVVGISSMLSNSGRFVANNIGARAVELYKSGGNTLFFENAGAQEIVISNSSTSPFKAGLAYAINDYQGAFNGTLGGVDTNTGGTIPNATSLSIGNLNNGNFINGTISSIRYYKKRLANDKLKTLTA